MEQMPRRVKESSRVVKFIIVVWLINMREWGSGGIRISLMPYKMAALKTSSIVSTVVHAADFVHQV